MNDLRSAPRSAEKIAPRHHEQRAYVYVRQLGLTRLRICWRMLW